MSKAVLAHPRAFPIGQVGAALAAGLAAHAGLATLGVVFVPFLIACVAALFGSAQILLFVLVGTSGIGFNWFEGGVSVGSHAINVSGLHWGLVVIVATAVLVRQGMPSLPRSWRWYVWFVVLAALGIMRSVDRFDGIKLTLQLAAPLLVGMVALRVLQRADDIDRLKRAFWIGLLLSVAGVVAVELTGFVGGGTSGLTGAMGDRTYAIYLIPLMALALAGMRHRSGLFAVVAGLLVLIAALTLSRTVVAAMLIMSVAAASKAPLGVRVSVLALVLVGALGVTQLAAFRSRFADNPYTGIGSARLEVTGEAENARIVVGGLALSGRGLAWLQTWRHAVQRPVLGWGTGASRSYLVQEVGISLHHPHNEYLRAFHDLGLVGLGLFVGAMLAVLRAMRRAYARCRGTPAGELTLAALLAWLGYMMVAVTDNAMVYVAFFTINVFVLLAMAERAQELAGVTSGTLPIDSSTPEAAE